MRIVFGVKRVDTLHHYFEILVQVFQKVTDDDKHHTQKRKDDAVDQKKNLNLVHHSSLLFVHRGVLLIAFKPFASVVYMPAYTTKIGNCQRSEERRVGKECRS